MKTAVFLALLAVPGLCCSQSAPAPVQVFTIHATASPSEPEAGYLQMGSSSAAKSPNGHTLAVNNRYLTLGGKPWLPVMGEFHYSRYPEKDWEQEIMKMKAGGIQIISSYVFWIHHEEVEGQFDWTGQRNLRLFAQLCAKHGMYFYPRIGPWDHGEVRNGGFPDWLLKKGPTRVIDPAFLSYVQKFYDEVGNQLRGLLWKDGGHVIGIQLENEYADRAPNGGEAYISRLKEMAIHAGLDLPLYTVTGWDNAVYPLHAVIPVFGGYPDEPWSGSTKELPPDVEHVYQFDLSFASTDAGILQGISTKPDNTNLWHYPTFTAETGPGVEVTYHRRVFISPNDVVPIAITALGSGVNLLGYYLFQGGANPDGKLTTLQESQATDYPNDVPVRSYDFQAPLGEFGQVRESYRKLKIINLFIQDFGSEVATMNAVLPDTVPKNTDDTRTLRVAARTNGNRGFLFFNNYVRRYPLPKQKSVQVVVKFPSETMAIPARPVDIASQSAFIWPVNMDLGGTTLKYATAQPFAKFCDGQLRYYFFSVTPGVAPEFAFASETLFSLTSKTGSVTRGDLQSFVRGLQPSTNYAMEIRSRSGQTARIVLLSEEQAHNFWRVAIHGSVYFLIAQPDVFSDSDRIHLRSRDPNLSFSIFPDLPKRFHAPALHEGEIDGMFRHYAANVPARNVQVVVEKAGNPQPVPPVKMGKPGSWRPEPVAEGPDDADFAKAAAWHLKLPKDAMAGCEELFLKINYVGDVGRLYSGTSLLDDNFYNGDIWEVGLKRFSPEWVDKGLDLKILPLRKDAPIYLPKNSWPNFQNRTQFEQLNSITAVPEYGLTLSVREERK